MFRKAWFRVALVLTILASLIAAPLFVSAQTDNGITVPAEGATVSGTVTVTGYADDPNFYRWDLFIFPGGDENARAWIASGSSAGEVSADLDTTNFADGEHVLSLRVVTNPQRNYSEYLTSFTIANGDAPAAAAPAEVEEEAEEAEEAEVAAPAPAEEPAAPANGFDLEEGASLSGTATVTGYADDANFKRWDLFIYPAGNEDAMSWVASGDEAGEFSVDVDTTNFPDGDYTFNLRVVTNPKQNYSEYTADFAIANAAAEPVVEEVAATETTTETVEAEAPAAVEAPAAEVRANGFDLEEGASLSGTATVTGYADDPNFKRWDLFIYPTGNEDAMSWVASGDEAGEFSVDVDTTNFPNGEYSFSLRVVTNPQQNYSEYVTSFVIANAE